MTTEAATRQRLIACASMRQRRTLAAGDDGVERHTVGASSACGKLQTPGHFRFANSGSDRSQGFLIYRGSEVDCATQQTQFFCVLDQALPHDQAGSGLPGDFLLADFAQLFCCGNGGVIGFVANAYRLPVADEVAGRLDQRALGDDDSRTHYLRRGLLGVTPIGEKDRPPAEEEQQAVAARVAAEIAQVRRVGDDESV